MPGQHPTVIDKKKLKKVELYHFAWSEVLTEAVVQKEHRGVADPDQAWVLSELIRYLEHPKSGALEFNNMGQGWVAARGGAKAGTLRASEPETVETVARFDALLRYVGLKLGRRLGTEVTMARSHQDAADPTRRALRLATELADSGRLAGALRIPHTVGNLAVTVDLRAGLASCSVDIDAPKEGKALTRVRWLTRQLQHAPDATTVEAIYAHQRGAGPVASLSAVRETPDVLVPDRKRELRTFRVSLGQPMGIKNGTGRGTFITSVEESVETFYSEVMQRLKAWRAAPPRLREQQPEPRPPVAAELVSTALSSQDGTISPDPSPASPVNG